jgi:hypothetical protein
MAAETKRPQPVAHDQTPSVITDHPFEPKGAWFTLCKHCNLAESAHSETTREPLHYIGDDVAEEE